jgi:hypothetical protein
LGTVAVVLAVAAGGCGSSGDTTEIALTKAQFIKRGDAICRSHQTERNKAFKAWREEPANKGKKFEDWTKQELGQVYLTVMLPPVKDAWRELDELAESTGDPKAEKFVSSLESAVKKVEEKPTGALEEVPYEDANKIAQGYGFKACGFF